MADGTTPRKPRTTKPAQRAASYFSRVTDAKAAIERHESDLAKAKTRLAAVNTEAENDTEALPFLKRLLSA